jgi:DNA polymerase-1
MTKQKDKIIIIDGNALLHRSFHALPPTISTKSGEIVNAVYGFTSFLIKAIRDIKPEYAVLTMDKKAPTFRNKLYKEYKAKRKKAPDELYMQIPRIKEVAKAFNIPIFELDGFEADDIIGTIAEKIKKNKLNAKSIIITGDMDTLQLVDNEYTNVYAMSRGLSDSVLYNKEKVQEKLKINPEQIVDYKALRGDPSDNIPGVKGIGEKTAVELLNKFNDLDTIYKKLEKETDEFSKNFKPRTLKLLEDHKKDAYLSKELAKIKCDVPIEFNLEKTRFNNYDIKKAIKLFTELEFKSLLPRLQELDNGGIKLTKKEILKKAENKFKRNIKDYDYILVDNDNKFKKFFSELKEVSSFTFDTETSGFDPLSADLLGISFSWKKGKAYYLKTTNSQKIKTENNLFNYKEKPEPEIKDQKLLKLKPIFENEKIKKSAHNAKFDIKVLNNQGIDVKGVNFDTMIASYLLNPGTRQHNLDAVVFTELGFEKISKEDLLGKGKDKILFSQVKTEKLFNYSCEDADFTFRLVKKLKPLLKEKSLLKLFEEIEMPLVPVLVKMENNGIKLNKKILEEMEKKISKTIKNLENKIHDLAGEYFNINSTKQLKIILFEKLDLPKELVKKTKTGLSTAADELKKLKDYHPIIPLLLEYRELVKLKSTYIDALPELINKKTNRIHTSFNQTITATGRLSSTEPNLQNIPIKSELGRGIRKAFVAEKGNKLLALDYSQIELRLAAHLSSDEKMIKAFKNKEDIHTATAAQINRVEIKDVTKQMRREAKAVNFGILYGQGPHGLAQSADMNYFKAKEFIDKYFEIYGGVKKYIANSQESARNTGYAETMFGRRRYLPEINSSVGMLRKGAERMAVNTPLQGTAADMIKVAMIKINKELPDSKMLIQVHDELIFEVKKEEISKFAPKIKNIMENVLKLKVPIIVDIKTGDNWGEMKEL